MLIFGKKLSYLLSIVLWFSASSCASQDLSSAMQACSEGGIAAQGDVVTNDEIMLSLLEGALAWASIEPLLVDVRKSKVSSPHSSESTNYLAVSENSGDFYSYYLSGRNSFPLCLNIKSPEVLLGISRTAKAFVFFADRLKETDRASLIIDTLEGGNIVQFIFSNGQLSSMVYRSNYLD